MAVANPWETRQWPLVARRSLQIKNRRQAPRIHGNGRAHTALGIGGTATIFRVVIVTDDNSKSNCMYGTRLCSVKR